MYRLQMNQQRVINGREVYGPTLMMRGLTNTQINSGHAFLVYLVFQIKYTRRNLNRHLESEKKIPSICIVMDSVDESEDELNIVEYECIGNLTEDENEELKLEEDYEINGIEENSANNYGALSESNLNNLAKSIDFKTLDKEYPTFTIGDVLKLTIFNLDQLKNYTSDNYTFDVSLNGQLTNDLEPKSFKVGIPITHIDKQVDCTFNIQENKTANLKCKLNIEQYKQYKNFTFKVTDIENDGNPIYLSRLNEIYLFNEAKEESGDNNNNTNNNKILIIVLSIVGGILIIGGVISGIMIYKHKHKKNKNLKMVTQEENVMNNVNNDVVYDSSKRGFKKSI